MDLASPIDQKECLNDQNGTGASFTKSVFDDDNSRLRKALEKATQHKEMGPEYIQSRKYERLFVTDLMKINSFCQATGTGTGTGTGNRESRIETVPVLTVKCPGPPPTHP